MDTFRDLGMALGGYILLSNQHLTADGAVLALGLACRCTGGRYGFIRDLCMAGGGDGLLSNQHFTADGAVLALCLACRCTGGRYAFIRGFGMGGAGGRGGLRVFIPPIAMNCISINLYIVKEGIQIGGNCYTRCSGSNLDTICGVRNNLDRRVTGDIDGHRVRSSLSNNYLPHNITADFNIRAGYYRIHCSSRTCDTEFGDRCNFCII